ncbi:MAG: hypothetical protein DRI71_11960 [Bacteroidetes bacterium]|nr:MAG: hypothetical protein DRI71_11960 [Bacteroidota bacterium]
MAFAAAITKKDVMGSHRVHMGTISQGNSDTGGAIATGLRIVENFQSTIHCTTLSVSAGEVTITTADPGGAQAGYWMAVGY